MEERTAWGTRIRRAAWAMSTTACLSLAVAAAHAEPGNTEPALVAELLRIGNSLDPTSLRSPANGTAKARLDALQHEHPDVPEIYRELARYYLVTGYQRGDDYEPAHLEAAAQALDKAVTLNPQYAEAWVVRGFVHRLQGNRELANAALDRAEEIGTDYVWLPLNRAELLIDAQRYDDAMALLRQVQARKNLDPSARADARSKTIEVLRSTGRNREADGLYRQAIEASPQNAWAHGNYAGFLLCAMDDEEAAVKQAEQARRLLDYGLARLVHAAALDRRWARQALAGQSAKAEESWNAAMAIMDSDPAMVVNELCGTGPAVAQVLHAMRATGKGARIPALVAVMTAAENAPRPVPGLFVLPVRSVGSNGGDVFLGSEEDYRDQRNLSIRIVPSVSRELARQLGSDSLEGLKGMTIEVLGAASRVRIDFREKGVPTGKFYYQTHVVVTRADQIVVRENRPAL